jgi:hypothetical protein
LSFDAVANSINSRISRHFSAEECGRRKAEVSEDLTIIIVDGHRAGPEEVG